MAHRTLFEQKNASVNPDKPILSGDVMDIVLEYSGVEKKEEQLVFFNNRGLFSLNEFHTKLEAHHRARITKLFYHVVRGKLKQAEAMIRQNPEYLLESADVMDYSGRRFHRTALQSALASKDVRFREDMEECMAEMIIRHLEALPHGCDAIATQINQQFPASWKESEEKENKQDLAAVEAVFQSIDHARSSEDCTPAIVTFRNYLKEKYLENKDGTPITMTTGFDFNHQMLLKAYELYDRNYFSFRSYWGSWKNPKNKLAWCQVIGYLQRFLSACDGMACAQGLYYLLEEEEREPFNRTLNFRVGNTAFFPILGNSGLGFDFVYAGGSGGPVATEGWGCAGDYFRKFMSGKNISICKLIQPEQDFRATSRCSIQ